MSSGHKGHEPCPAHASSTIGRRELLVAGGLSLMTGPARQAAAAISATRHAGGAAIRLPCIFVRRAKKGIVTAEGVSA